jgi:hypothetical protein
MPDFRDIMPFRTIPFRDLVWGVARRAGMVPEEDGVDRAAASLIAEALGSALYFAWTFWDWEECSPAALFAVTVDGDGRRFVPRRVQGTWDGDSYQPGHDLHTVRGVWTADPTLGGEPIRWLPSFGVIALIDSDLSNGDEVWIQYALPPPRTSSAIWSASKIYRRNDVVISDEGELFVCIAPESVVGSAPAATGGNPWQWQYIPEVLAEAVKAGGFALYTQTEGKFDTATMLAGAMTVALESEVLRKTHSESQYKSYTR